MSGLKKNLKLNVKKSTTLNPIKRAKLFAKEHTQRAKQVEKYFAKPKFPEQVPAEMEDEYTTSRSRNRDMIRRRQSGGRSSTIMSDTLG